MEIRITVLGAGSWGTTVASLAAQNTATTLWARRPDAAEEIRDDHVNSRYLPDYRLPETLHATADLEEAVSTADVLVMGVPSSGFREAVADARPFLRPWVPVISLTKGIEQGSRLRMTEVISEELPGHPVGVLTGPNLAKEILAGHAAASVIALTDLSIATALQDCFTTEVFRVYTNHDLVGCELGGALKNVIAIASGMADGLGAGDNTRAAVITRGLSELTRLGSALGGEPITFSGLAGMGDLMATCISKQSRNRHVGEELGKGKTIEKIIEEMNQVAEGVKSCRAIQELGREHDVEMPITDEVVRVCYEGASAEEAYRGLLKRNLEHEMHGIH
ncbi:MAG TPA: NAD(P)H-dependent glycerol-3-phosphate dehydrogenase [Acidimicrobiales bacterium]|nr:NAD(P)H-dependent glycerol-3-phosphate dehydrogenase [Acidimicrobiales bacterium]